MTKMTTPLHEPGEPCKPGCPAQCVCKCKVPENSAKACICRSCHGKPWEVHVFSNIRAFDEHRHGPWGTDRCKDPQECGLELKTDRPYPYWGRTGEKSEEAIARRRGTPRKRPHA